VPRIKTHTYWMLVHPQAPDLAWGPRGWRLFKDATVFSDVGKAMFRARRDERGRWMRYPDVLTMPPERIGIDLANPGTVNDNAIDHNGRAVTRERNRLAREERARILRKQDPLPAGVKHDVP
jgi:hypothetical protein